MARKPKPTGRKAERSHGVRRRSANRREPRPRFLIVCEGAKSEPGYFKGFRVSARVIGYHVDPHALVRRTDELRRQDDYDQVWCVFDRDDVPPDQFHAAIQLAAHLGIHVAYSNQAFELWYVLHFQYLNTAVDRDDYKKMLTKYLGAVYKKSEPDIYWRLLHKQSDALQNASRLYGLYDPHIPEQDDPSTTVHLLVEELNRFAH
jgi:RloB-like protein